MAETELETGSRGRSSLSRCRKSLSGTLVVRFAHERVAVTVFIIDEDFRKAIQAGINVVHINTELRVAWRRGLEEGLAKKPGEVVPYKILPSAVESVKQVVLSRLKLFNIGRSHSRGV